MTNKIIKLVLLILLTSCSSKPINAAKIAIVLEEKSKSQVDAISDKNTVAVSKNDLVSAENNIIKEGKNLYENNCGNCHKLFNPKEFTKTEWQPILYSMQKKAHLSDAEIDNIGLYINSIL